ncbi:MAG: flagellar biosynthetic protein FliR [Thioalkalivibrionaceae bacterium]
MSFAAEDLLVFVAGVLWPFARISAFLVAAPLFGASTVNLQARMALAFLLALLVAPWVAVPVGIDPFSFEGFLITAAQVLIGAAMGFVLQLVFSAFTQAGEVIALSMGLGFASIADPATGVSVPMVAQFFTITATLLFFAMNGHLVALEVLIASFQFMPVGLLTVSPQGLYAIATFGAVMFAGAVLIAIPALAALLVVNLAMGVVTRAAPALNIFAVGFPVMILFGFVLLLLILPGFPDRLGELLSEAFRLIVQLLPPPT